MSLPRLFRRGRDQCPVSSVFSLTLFLSQQPIFPEKKIQENAHETMVLITDEHLQVLPCSFCVENEPILGENLSAGFPTRSDTNRAVQPQKKDRG